MNKSEIKSLVLVDISKTEILIEDCLQIIEPLAPDCSVDHSLRMEKLNEDEFTRKILIKAKQKLINLNRVLNQINKADFGICLTCKSAIPFQRILIRPESLVCVKCAE